MKRVLCLILALTLGCGLALPVAAQSTAEDQLAQVTTRVKATLGIGDSYDSFYGESVFNGANTYWSLNWSDKTSSLMVEADADGKVMSYYYNAPEEADASSGNLPAFPKTTRAQAQALAQAFLGRVLVTGERAAFDAADGAVRTGTTQHRFSGSILLNGLPGPIRFSITVRAGDGEVLRFHRGDLNTKYLGGVPSATPAANRDQAVQALRGTLSLGLEYVLDETGKTAVLRYLPQDNDQYYVDARTGALVNLTGLYNEVAQKNGIASTAGGGDGTIYNTMEAAAELSRVEQEGIAKLEGVRAKEDLDARVRALEGLGLTGYTLSAASYRVDRETGQVTAQLEYVRGDATGWRRTVTVDARTAALESLYGNAPYDEDRQAKLTQDQAQARAEAFLTGLWGEQFAKTACYSSEALLSQAKYTFTFAQRENGYFFPGNAISISVDALDGSICGLSRTFDETVAFDSPDGLITQEAALDAWFATYTNTLGYLAVPQALDPSRPESKPFLDAGIGYLYALKLTYYLDRADRLSGIDAKTGTPVAANVQQDTGIAYSDMEGNWAQRQVEALADYGIGYYGGTFQPQKQLTQLDLVALLASAQGYRYLPGEKDAADALYRFAYDMGLLTAAQRRDDALLSRAETVKLLLDAAGYGAVASLEGIFKCGFADEAEIPAAYYGYAAIAQGLGMVSGDAAGRFAPNRTATRLEAAVMLYNFMNR